MIADFTEFFLPQDFQRLSLADQCKSVVLDGRSPQTYTRHGFDVFFSDNLAYYFTKSHFYIIALIELLIQII